MSISDYPSTATQPSDSPNASAVAAPRAGAPPARVVPHNRSPRFVDFFAWYTRRLFRKRFAAVRFERESLAAFAELDAAEGPLIMLGNHPSWWDPLVAVLLNSGRLPHRPMMAVMDADELERFKMFKKLGVMGVDPDDPAALDPMVAYLEGEFAREPRSTLWITPQGHFTDVRAPLRLRPGAAKLAARLPGVRVGALAMEFSFWDEQLPELFLRFEPVATPDTSSTTNWLRTMTEAMRTNQAALTDLVIARTDAPFETIAGKGGSSHHPVYDLYLRLTGRGGKLGERRRQRADPGEPTYPQRS